MANEIKYFRSALAQNDRNKPMYGFMVIEIVIMSLMFACVPGYYFDSDLVTLVSFVGILVSLIVCISVPILRFVGLTIMGIGWAFPFIILGQWVGGGAFYILGVAAFFASFLIHYWGTTYLDDLSRSDD